MSNPFLTRTSFPFPAFGGPPRGRGRGVKLLFAVAVAVAGAVRFGPPNWGEQAKHLVREGLPPLRTAWETVATPAADWLRGNHLPVPEANETNSGGETIAAKTASTNGVTEIDRLREQLETVEARSHQLEAQLFRHQEQITRMTRDGVSPFRLNLPAPPTDCEAVTARLIGVEQDFLGRTHRPLVGAGSQQGVQQADFAVAAPRSGKERQNPSVTQTSYSPGQWALDVGSESGIEADQPVFAGRRVIGRIKQTGRNTSTLLPVDDSQYRGHAQILRETPRGPVVGARGVLRGKEPGHAILEHVLAEAPVVVNDLVFTAGQDAPAGFRLFYGRIIRCEVRPGAAEWEIDVELPQSGPAPEVVQLIRP